MAGLRDFLALVARWWASKHLTPGPYQVAAAIAVSTGAVAGKVFSAGAADGCVFSAGAMAAAVVSCQTDN